jgi:DNA processing protein
MSYFVPDKAFLYALTRQQGLSINQLRLLKKTHTTYQSLWEYLNPTTDNQDVAESWAALLKLAQTMGFDIIAEDEPNYPLSLKQLPQPPLLLYVWGKVPDLSSSLAIVGTRKASVYGLEIAKTWSQTLASYGMTIVSGGALGIDTAAHQGAMSKTVVVLAQGFGCIYPRQNQKLFEDIVEQGGAIVSEHPPDRGSDKHLFPLRNRIIAALTQGVFVVEAPIKSGTHYTVETALELGKDVFTVPGPIQYTSLKGNFQLLRDGAILVDTPQDILNHLNVNKIAHTPDHPTPHKQHPYPLNSLESNVLTLLIEPLPLDAIASKLDLAISDISMAMMMLEMDDWITQISPGIYKLGY